MTNEISFTCEGAKYTLAFTRRTVQQLCQQGFSPDMVTDKPAVGVPMLFRGAFLANHRGMRPDKIDAIYDNMVDKTGLIGKLLEMYLIPINEMLEDPEEDEEKNVKWEATF